MASKRLKIYVNEFIVSQKQHEYSYKLASFL